MATNLKHDRWQIRLKDNFQRENDRESTPKSASGKTINSTFPKIHRRKKDPVTFSDRLRKVNTKVENCKLAVSAARGPRKIIMRKLLKMALAKQQKILLKESKEKH